MILGPAVRCRFQQFNSQYIIIVITQFRPEIEISKSKFRAMNISCISAKYRAFRKG